MDGELLAKRYEVLIVEGRRRRGRPQLSWEDCVKRYLFGLGGDGE